MAARRNVGHGQSLVGKASGDCRSGTNRLVLPHPVVVDKVERERMAMVLEFFAERVCQAGEAAH